MQFPGKTKRYWCGFGVNPIKATDILDPHTGRTYNWPQLEGVQQDLQPLSLLLVPPPRDSWHCNHKPNWCEFQHPYYRRYANPYNCCHPHHFDNAADGNSCYCDRPQSCLIVPNFVEQLPASSKVLFTAKASTRLLRKSLLLILQTTCFGEHVARIGFLLWRQRLFLNIPELLLQGFRLLVLVLAIFFSRKKECVYDFATSPSHFSNMCNYKGQNSSNWEVPSVFRVLLGLPLLLSFRWFFTRGRVFFLARERDAWTHDNIM